MDLHQLSRGELVALREQIDSILSISKQQAVEKARKEIQELLAKSGLSTNDVLRSTYRTDAVHRLEKGTPVYRNPRDHADTWTGAGRYPDWFRDYIAKGGNPEDLRIATNGRGN